MAKPTLSFSICQANTCDSMVFTETTGTYSVNNLTGWNTPNTSIDDAIGATLFITDPAGTTFEFDLFAQSPSFPTIDDTQEFTIVPTDLNQANGKFLDGLYKFQYTVDLDTDDALSEITIIGYQFFYCNIQCCVNKMFAKITDPVCDCQADAIATASKADALLTALIKAAKCGKTSVFNTLTTILNRMCTNINCDTCN